MKKVLLTTTALVMTAGVASAEITFSGKGEAGFYRNAPTAAAAAVRGNNAQNGAVVDSTTDATGGVAYNADGVLTVTKATASGQTATNAYGAAPTAAEIAAQADVVADAQGALAAAERALAESTATTQFAKANLASDVADAQALVALEQAVLAEMSGTAAVAKGATPNLAAYSGYDFDVAVSGASDNGMTFAMGFDMGEGMIADQDDDRAMDAQGAAIATSAMTIGYAGYTIEIGDDKIDDVYDDTQNGDVAISGALGDLTFKIVHDMNDDVQAVAASTTYTAESGVADGIAADGSLLVGAAAHTGASFTQTAAVAAVYNTTSYSLGYTMGDVAFAMASTDHDDRGNPAS